MAHGVNAMLKRSTNTLGCKNDGKTGIGSRRIFAPQFKLQVLDSYRNDADCKGNQRATARKYGIHRRQIQKWLQVENNLRNSVNKSKCSELIVSPEARKCGLELALRSVEHSHRQRDDVCVDAYARQQCRDVETTEGDRERVVAQQRRMGGLEVRDAAMVDKRVPNIPQQHSPTTTNALNVFTTATTTTTLQSRSRPHYEWHSVAISSLQRQGTPDENDNDTLSGSSRSRSGSERDIVEVFGNPSSHCSPSPPSSTLAYSPPIVSAPQPSFPLSPLSHHTPHVVPPATASARLSPLCPVPVSIPISSSCVCPEQSALPLDFTTRNSRHAVMAVFGPSSPRGATTSSPVPHSPVIPRPTSVPAPTSLTIHDDNNCDSAAPMDLSLKKPYITPVPLSLLYPHGLSDLHTPVSVAAATPPAPHMPLDAPRCCRSPHSLPLAQHPQQTNQEDSQIWDLSTRGVKRRRNDHHDDFIAVSSSSLSTHSSRTTATVPNSVAIAAGTNRPKKLFKPYLDNILDDENNVDCQSSNGSHSSDIKPVVVTAISNDNYSHFTSNNNNTDYKMDYATTFYKDEHYHHEDAAPAHHHHHLVYCPDYYQNFMTNNGLHYDDVCNQFIYNNKTSNSNSIKQRQSYSLDFKLSAIECYYSDALCRGNQRAVASKFKIHRRQVQKWLKQEDQLRQRNETAKPIIPMHIVR